MLSVKLNCKSSYFILHNPGMLNSLRLMSISQVQHCVKDTGWALFILNLRLLNTFNSVTSGKMMLVVASMYLTLFPQIV